MAVADMDAKQDKLIEEHMSFCVRHGGIVSCMPDAVWMGFPAENDGKAFVLLYCCGSREALEYAADTLMKHGYERLWSVRGWRGKKDWHCYDLRRFARLMKTLKK